MAQGKRQQQVGNQIQQVISKLFQQEAREYLLQSFATVSGVRMTQDLGTARVYVSVLQQDKVDEVLFSLNENNKAIRRALGNEMRHHLRRIPYLEFFKDDSLEEAYKIDAIFKALHKENKQNQEEE